MIVGVSDGLTYPPSVYIHGVAQGGVGGGYEYGWIRLIRQSEKRDPKLSCVR